MELKHIKELMAVMSRTGTKRLRVKEGDFELTLERPDQSSGRYIIENSSDFAEERIHSHGIHRPEQAYGRASELPSSNMIPPQPSQEDANSFYVTSPMVGTFYAAQSPTDAPFVKPGDKIDKNTVVCIVEAMKVMNEIKANVVGTVAEVLVESGQPVEFGAKLFRMIES